MRKLFFFAIFLFPLICLSATKYVSYDGVGDGSTAETPMGIKAAFAECGAGNTYVLATGTYEKTNSDPYNYFISGETPASTCTFRSATGNAEDVVFTSDGTQAGYTGAVSIVASINIKFEDVTMESGAGTNAYYGLYLISNATTMTGIEFDNCIFSGTVAAKPAIYAIGSAGQPISATFSYCTISASGTSLGINTVGTDVLTIDHCTITKDGTAGAAGGAVVLSTSQNTKFTNNTVSSDSGTYIVTIAAAGTAGRATITGNVITGENGVSTYGLFVYDYYTNVLVSNNTITSHSNAANMSGIGVGVDGQTPGSAMGQVVVHDNTFAVTGTTTVSGHGILIGGGADGADVYNNKIVLPATGTLGTALGLVVKAERCNIHNNIFVAPDALLVKGGKYNNFYNNDFIANARYAASCFTDPDGTTTSYGNNFINNIFDGSGGTYAFYSISAETLGAFNNRFDYNCYRAGSTGLSAFDGSGATKQAALEGAGGLEAYWEAATSSLWTSNDDHSIEANPDYSETTTYALSLSSPCLNTGVATLGSGKTSIGSYQGEQVLDEPEAAEVLTGVTFYNGSRAGTVVLPSASTVKNGTAYGAGSATTGTMKTSSGWW